MTTTDQLEQVARAADAMRKFQAENRTWTMEDLARAAIAAMQGEALAWLGPIPHDGSDKPEWVPDHAIVMLAWNPREHQTAMTWEFAAKRKAPAKGRGWEGATAFCIETPLYALPPAPKDAHHDA